MYVSETIHILFITCSFFSWYYLFLHFYFTFIIYFTLDYSIYFLILHLFLDHFYKFIYYVQHSLLYLLLQWQARNKQKENLSEDSDPDRTVGLIPWMILSLLDTSLLS